MSFPPEDRAHVGNWKPGHIHGQKEALLTLLEEAGAGESVGQLSLLWAQGRS